MDQAVTVCVDMKEIFIKIIVHPFAFSKNVNSLQMFVCFLQSQIEELEGKLLDRHAQGVSEDECEAKAAQASKQFKIVPQSPGPSQGMSAHYSSGCACFHIFAIYSMPSYFLQDFQDLVDSTTHYCCCHTLVFCSSTL